MVSAAIAKVLGVFGLFSDHLYEPGQRRITRTIESVHLRSVRPQRRIDPTHPYAPRHGRQHQVLPKCGAWAPKRLCTRDVRRVTCLVCRAMLDG